MQFFLIGKHKKLAEKATVLLLRFVKNQQWAFSSAFAIEEVRKGLSLLVKARLECSCAAP